MPVIEHRPVRFELDHCERQGPFIYIAGAVAGAPDFQQEVTQLFARQTPKDTTLHIANPRWDDIPDAGRLTVTEQYTWEEDHYQTAAYLGRGGLLLFCLVPESPAAPCQRDPREPYGLDSLYAFAAMTNIVSYARDHGVPPPQLELFIDPGYDGPDLPRYYHGATGIGLNIHTDLRTAAEYAIARVIPGITPPAT